MKKIELTPQEIKLVKLIGKQMTAREIADVMGLSFRTVEGYRTAIQRKIGAKNTVGIAIYGLKQGIIRI